MNQPRFHLLSPGIVPGDAVSNDVLGMAAYLRQQGFVAEVYGSFVHPVLRGVARHITAYEREFDNPDDILLYHHSVGWPVGISLWEKSRNRKVLRYHNTTPGRFFQAYDPPTADLCRMGALETRRLSRSGPELALACSDFNAVELARFADRPYPIEIVPPFHTIGELDHLPLDEELAARLLGTLNLLFVGRTSPHKGHGRLLRVLACCRERFGNNVRLHIVGGRDERLKLYYQKLRAEITARQLDKLVCFTGKVTPSELKTYYRCADTFLCLSEHEGFCVPLVEAMHLGVPIVAYRGSAISSTLGEHPFLWNAPDPQAAAESIRLIVEDERVRASIKCLQQKRYEQHFTPAVIGHRLANALAEILPGVNLDGTDVPAEQTLQLV